MAAISLPIQRRSVELSCVVDGEIIKPALNACDASMTSCGSLSTRSGGARPEDLDPISPVNWRIRNTFLDTPMLSPTALQSFQRRRRALSVPAGGREAIEREDLKEVVFEEETDEESPVSPASQLFARALEEEAATPSKGPLSLSLADLVPSQFPSAGSSLHSQGACKPCAFFWKEVGCKGGLECQFCHVCDVNERKRRNKEKKMAMYAMQHGDVNLLPPNLARHVRMGGA